MTTELPPSRGRIAGLGITLGGKNGNDVYGGHDDVGSSVFVVESSRDDKRGASYAHASDLCRSCSYSCVLGGKYEKDKVR